MFRRLEGTIDASSRRLERAIDEAGIRLLRDMVVIFYFAVIIFLAILIVSFNLL